MYFVLEGLRVNTIKSIFQHGKIVANVKKGTTVKKKSAKEATAEKGKGAGG